MEQNIQSIPKEKFNFVQRNDLTHDKKLATKPRGYFADAFVRFCKNKGAVVGAIIIIILVLCSIIAPMCTPYDVKYMDSNYKSCFPDNPLFAGLPVWDGCEERKDSKGVFMKYYAMGEETGLNAVKNQAYRIEDDLYVYRLNSVNRIQKYRPERAERNDDYFGRESNTNQQNNDRNQSNRRNRTQYTHDSAECCIDRFKQSHQKSYNHAA